MKAGEPAPTRQPRRRARPSAPTKKSRRRKPPALAGRPHVLVLGKNDLSTRVVRAVRGLGVQCRRVETPEEARGGTNELTKALLIVPPIPNVSVLAFARGRTAEGANVPIFVVMEGPLPTRTVGKLYEQGVEAVFEWPMDRKAVKRTVFRLSGPELGSWGRTKSATEVALEETARTHLDVDAVPFGAHFGVEACHRFVILKGKLSTLWQLELARQIVAEIPGVEDVIAEGVEITGHAQGDRATAKAIREVLRHASAVEASTLAVAVRSGEVALTGSARDKHEASRALDLVRQVRGVRRVRDYLVVSARRKGQDKALARRVRDALRTRYPDIPVELAVFGKVAVLSGRVPRAAIRDQMKQLVYGQEGVARVVDKLNVSGRARR